LRGLELRDPVDGLVAVVVYVAVEVDHHLAAGQPADTGHARPREEGRRHVPALQETAGQIGGLL
jgi:hypothetical protein